MSINLLSTQSITLELAAAPATNQPMCSASWADQNGVAAGNEVAASGTTPIVLVAAPAAGVSRVVNEISVLNTDTAPIKVLIARVTSGTTNIRNMFTLAAGYTLAMALDGWSVHDANGILQTGSSGGGGVVNWGAIGGTLSSQTDLATALAAKSNLGAMTANTQTGTTYTLAATDAGKDVQCTNAAAVTVSLPLNSTTAFPIGSWLLVSQGGAGVVTVTGVLGVTIQAPNGAATAGVGDLRGVEKIATDTWRVI
jgi:hypothetical protein